MTVQHVPGRPVPTKDTENRLNKKRQRQKGQMLVRNQLKEQDHYVEYMSHFPALALASGSPTLMSML